MPDLSLPRQERSAKNTPKRSSSNIIRRGLNSLLGSSRAESPPPLPRSGLQWEEPDESENRDTLPCGKANLEARLNYHLSELDRLRNYIQLMNQIICEHETRLADISARGMGMLFPFLFLRGGVDFIHYRNGCLSPEAGDLSPRHTKGAQRLRKAYWLSPHRGRAHHEEKAARKSSGRRGTSNA